ncbi:hypothetical protein P9112_008153 [Eukaryota sp. TZLM1-RC]
MAATGVDYQVVVVGSGGVGKSALSARFVLGKFLERYDPTIEDSYRKAVDVDGSALRLEIMDTAGQDEYDSIREQYLQGGNGFLLVYAIDSQESFDKAVSLRDQILSLQNRQDVPIVLVGNKCDLEDARAVTNDEGKLLAEKFGCEFFETSAKEEVNVDEAFYALVRAVMNDSSLKPLASQSGKKKSFCSIL